MISYSFSLCIVNQDNCVIIETMNIVFLAIIKLLLIVSLGFYLKKQQVLKEEGVNFLTFFVINISIPFLIFSNIITNYHREQTPSVWLFILLSIAIFALGLILSILPFFHIKKEFRREYISLASFQNAGYLPMNIAVFLFSPAVRDKFLLYIFLYLLGFNILIWSIGNFFIFKRPNDKFVAKSLFTPPVISIILSLIIVNLGTAKLIPPWVISPIEMVGQTSFVLSMIILGAWLEKCPFSLYVQNPAALKASVLKLIVIPAVVFLVIYTQKIYSLLGFFLLLQASLPSAVSLPIIADMHGGNSKFISYVVFLTHIISIISVPLWIGLFLKVSNFIV
ncbi:MAG: AEC family transporter [Candidatus Omnitrophota bacterium]